MAKSNVVQIKLVSSADTGFFYVTQEECARAQTNKLELKKAIDPVARKHVVFKAKQRLSSLAARLTYEGGSAEASRWPHDPRRLLGRERIDRR